MPIRGDSARKKGAKATEYSYDEVVDKLRAKIDEEFGGVAKFLDSPEYKSTGLGEGHKDKAKIYTYLSAPTETSKRVKSFPVVQKLLQAVYNLHSEQRKEIIVQQKVIIDGTI